jgi:hypothetical protein
MGTYQPLGGRTGVFATYAVTSILGLVVVVVDVLSGRLTWWFDGYLLLSVPWNAYWWLVRLTTRLDVGDDRVDWETPLRSGTIAAGDLVSVRSVRFVPGVVAVRDVAGRSVLVLAQKGFTECASAIGVRFPHVEVELRSDAGWGDRVPGRSAWSAAPPPAPTPASAAVPTARRT